MRKVTLAEVQHLAHKLAQEKMEWNQPIPDFSTRTPGVLESCLSQIFLTYSTKDLYPGLVKKAAMLFYLMTKNHPFVNGNKRIAVTTLLTFLYLNNKWLNVTGDRLYMIAVLVAKSDPKLQRSVVAVIEEFLTQNLTEL